MTGSRFSLIIPAAGSGRRMESETPKPFLRIAGKTLLEHTLLNFTRLPGLGQVIVVASDAYRDEVMRAAGVLPAHAELKVVSGGRERQDSIRNALKQIDKSAVLTVVHDAVRPFVTPDEIERCLREADEHGAAVLAVPVSDTIKRAGPEGVVAETPDREGLWQAQTPQIFRTSLLVEAYRNAAETGFAGTDDASLVEQTGATVRLVRGSAGNIKITYPSELRLAKLLLEERQ